MRKLVLNILYVRLRLRRKSLTRRTHVWKIEFEPATPHVKWWRTGEDAKGLQSTFNLLFLLAVSGPRLTPGRYDSPVSVRIRITTYIPMYCWWIVTWFDSARNKVSRYMASKIPVKGLSSATNLGPANWLAHYHLAGWLKPKINCRSAGWSTESNYSCSGMMLSRRSLPGCCNWCIRPPKEPK